jgi:para-nitrobenzyl esterase
MQEYWTNFAKNGDPNGPGLQVWPKYEVKSKQYIEFSNDGPIRKNALRAATCGIYVEKIVRDLDGPK